MDSEKRKIIYSIIPLALATNNNKVIIFNNNLTNFIMYNKFTKEKITLDLAKEEDSFLLEMYKKLEKREFINLFNFVKNYVVKKIRENQ